MIFALGLLLLVGLVQLVLVRNSRVPHGRTRPPGWLANTLLWGALLFLASLTSLFFLDALPAPEMAPRGRQRLQKRIAEERLAESQTQAEPGSRSVADETAQALFDRTFPSGWKASGSLQQLRHEEVMRVRAPEGTSTAKFRAGAPYYLRGLVLGEFNRQGSQAAIPAALPLWVDEDQDGWIEFDAPSARDIELRIEQVPLVVRRGAWNVLFAARPLQAVRAERVLFAKDALLALPAVQDEERTHYSVRSPDLRFDRDCSKGLNSGASPHPRWIQLPATGSAVDFLRSTAKEWTRGARSDAERVERIAQHFQAEFAYAAISADVPGLAGIQNFLELERGYCTYFAAGTTLLLRALGIPARVATGFLVDEWDDEADAFVVTTQNGHAWTEVWFQGLGWLRVESTPGERRLRALGRLGEGPSGLNEWASTFGKDLGFVLRSGVRSSDVAVLGETVKALPLAFSRSAKKQPWLFGGIVLALASWTAWRMRRRGVRRDRGSTREGPRSVPLELEERFRAALIERGAPRLASATLREQSRSVGVGQGIAEALGRLRYGSGEAPESLLAEIREGVAALESAA